MLRSLGSVKLEPQQLQAMRNLAQVKMEPQHSEQSLFLQQQQQQQQRQFLQMPGQSPQTQMNNILHQQRLMQLQHQQHLLKSLPQQRPQLPQQQRPPMRPVYEPGMGAQRLTQYMYRQQHRPEDNNIEFWRKFVSEYFAPNAKKRWMCGTVRYVTESLGVVLNSSGQIVLEYAKATQESVFEQLRVVRDGQLRIVFSPDLKIFSWEFCARRHEELIPRRLLIPQVTSRTVLYVLVIETW
ncbi:BnaA10g28850D, partial [Brassica napus]